MIEQVVGNYRILTELYPYEESRKILNLESSDWWQHELRVKNQEHNSQNYSMNDDIISGLSTSLNRRLNEGCFNFLYHNTQLLAYAGMRVHNGDSYIHRLATNPSIHMKHFGVISNVLIKTQANIAKDIGCSTYSLTFNQHRIGIYEWLKNKKFLNSKMLKIQGGGEFISNFEFVGIKKIYDIDQYVCTLDLKRSDINELLRF
jgi:hypothetical protein